MYHYNENYVVNEYGELFSLFGYKIKKLKPYINASGYYMYRLRIDGKTVQKSAHFLSYWVNIGHFDKSDGLQIDHIDGNKLNNHYTNLRRVTPRDNCNNINTVGELTAWSRSNYRITDSDCLPSKYIKDREYVPSEHLSPRLRYVNGKVERCNLCDNCGDLTSGKLCLNCFNAKRASNIPTREELIKDLMSHEPLVKLSAKYGISDNAYRKWLAKRGLPVKYKDIKSFLMSV